MKFKTLLLTISISLVYLLSVSFQSATPLQGVWEYQGGKYNRQRVTASPVIKLQKVYTATGYQILAISPNGKTVKNEEGAYTLKNNVYTETRTSGSMPLAFKSNIMSYTYDIKNNTLTIKGKLTNKWPVEEYWKKVK